MLPAGCGGGGESSSKKKKKKRKKKPGDAPEKKEEGGEGEASEELIQREMIKDVYKGVYSDLYKGNAGPPELYRAMQKALTALEKFDRTEWNETFEKELMGLNYGRVECGEWFLKKQKAEAGKDPENLEAARAALEKVKEFMAPVKREDLSDNVSVGGNPVNYQQYYDDAMAKLDKAFKDLDALAEIMKRTPPAGGAVNLMEADEALWIKEGEIDATIGGGDFMLEAKKAGDRITATHYYLKNFTLKVTFMLNSGGFDILCRALPGKASVYYGGFLRDQLPDPNAPFTMVFEMMDSTLKIMDDQGRELGDPVRTDRGPKGGGIMIKLVSPGTSIIFQEMLLEPK